MKILYLSQYFPPEMGAPAARASELSLHWARAGHQVTVLTGFPNHPTGVVRKEYRARFRRLLARETFTGVDVVRTWLLPFPNRKAYERILNYTSFCLSSAITGLRIPSPDVVIGTSPQLLVALSAWWLARMKRTKFIFEVRDLWPESLSAVGMGGDKSLLHRSLKAIASFLYSRADHIVVVTPAFKDHLVRFWNVLPENISVIANGVETALFSPDRRDQTLRARLRLEARFVVCYIGTLGMAHGLETLVEAARIVQADHPEIAFLIVGEGADKQRIVALAKSLGLNNICFIDEQPREDIPRYINASDAALVLLRKNDVFKTVIPTKMLEFMSCASPLIVGVEGQAQQMVEESGAGICFEPENARALANAVLTMAANQTLRESCGRRGRRFIVERLSRKKTAQEYLKLLENLVSPAVAKSSAA